MNSNEKIIDLSRKKIILLFLGSLVFVALGFWMYTLDAEIIRSLRRFNNPVFVHGIGLVSIVFFGLSGLYTLRKLFDKKPGLIFNELGIVDNDSGVSAGLIPWSDITGSEIFEIQKQKMLIIKVRNPQKYIDRGGFWKRALVKSNYKMCGNPIAISSTALKINFSELLSLFNEYRQKYDHVQ